MFCLIKEMFSYIFALCLGIYFGQEFGNAIPNVKEKFISSCTSLKEYLDKIEREKRGIN